MREKYHETDREGDRKHGKYKEMKKERVREKAHGTQSEKEKE